MFCRVSEIFASHVSYNSIIATEGPCCSIEICSGRIDESVVPWYDSVWWQRDLSNVSDQKSMETWESSNLRAENPRVVIEKMGDNGKRGSGPEERCLTRLLQ
jgi:hypothetical protein